VSRAHPTIHPGLDMLDAGRRDDDRDVNVARRCHLSARCAAEQERRPRECHMLLDLLTQEFHIERNLTAWKISLPREAETPCQMHSNAAYFFAAVPTGAAFRLARPRSCR
jgi:hypothetical protein